MLYLVILYMLHSSLMVRGRLGIRYFIKNVFESVNLKCAQSGIFATHNNFYFSKIWKNHMFSVLPSFHLTNLTFKDFNSDEC